MPEGYCTQGHRLDGCPAIQQGRKLKCSFCMQSFDSEIFNCFCNQRACIGCLKDKRTAPPPPLCPSLSCTERCFQRSRPLTQKCDAGNHNVPPRTQLWQCRSKTCKAVICFHCVQHRSSATAQPHLAESTHPLPSHNACSSSPSSESHRAPAPMQDTKKQ